MTQYTIHKHPFHPTSPIFKRFGQKIRPVLHFHPSAPHQGVPLYIFCYVLPKTTQLYGKNELLCIIVIYLKLGFIISKLHVRKTINSNDMLGIKSWKNICQTKFFLFDCSVPYWIKHICEIVPPPLRLMDSILLFNSPEKMLSLSWACEVCGTESI